MSRLSRLPLLLLLAALLATLGACETTQSASQKTARAALEEGIRNEPPGNYFVGRRFYKRDYKFWGFVRKPGQAWSTAKLVMLNEQTKLAPDRELGILGSDNNYEYKLYGDFSGQTVYEPASNGFYPEFVLKAYELRTSTPAAIYREPGATDPSRRVIAKPYEASGGAANFFLTDEGRPLVFAPLPSGQVNRNLPIYAGETARRSR